MSEPVVEYRHMPRRANLQGSKRKDGRWHIRVTLTRANGAKVPRDVYGATQSEVQEKALALLYETGRRAPSAMKMAQLIALYRRVRLPELDKSTQRGYIPALRRIEARFGAEKVADILPFTISAWLRQLKEEGVTETVQTKAGEKEVHVHVDGRNTLLHKAVFSALMAFAIEQGIIDRNPCSEFKSKGAKPKVRPILDEDTWKAACAKASHPYNLLFRMLGETAARPDEAMRVTREDIYIDSGRFWITIHDSKTEAGENRALPISNALAGEFQLLPPGRLFTMHIRTVADKWKDALEAAEAAYTNPYQMRKLAVTRWAVAGVTKAVAIALVGHKDSKLIEQVYTRVTPAQIAKSLAEVGL